MSVVEWQLILHPLNDHEDKVFMIFALNEEVEDMACKPQCFGGVYHFMDTIQNNDCAWFIYIKKIVPKISLSNNYK